MWLWKISDFVFFFELFRLRERGLIFDKTLGPGMMSLGLLDTSSYFTHILPALISPVT